MSSTSATAETTRRPRLPAWIAPRPQSDRDPASRDVRAIETTILVLLGLLLAAAVVWDVVLQVRLNKREFADRVTWLAYAHVADIKTRLDIRPLERGTTDYVCRATSTNATQALHQVRLCLMISGPAVRGRRHVDGGYYIPPKRRDLYSYRYGCFGVPAENAFCGAANAAAAASAPVVASSG